MQKHQSKHVIIKCNDVNDHQIAIMTDGSSVVSEAIVSIKLAQQWEPRNINAAASFSKMRRVSVCMLFPNCQISHLGYFHLLMNVTVCSNYATYVLTSHHGYHPLLQHATIAIGINVGVGAYTGCHKYKYTNVQIH